MSRCRRVAVAVGLALGFVLLLPAGPVHADDCSSPSDCSNTAWTVAGGAAVAAAIVGAAMAAGGRNGQGSGGEECDEVAVLRSSIRGRYQRLAELAVLRKGALTSKARAEAQLQAAKDWAERLAREEQISTTLASAGAAAGSTGAAYGAGRAAQLESAHLVQRRLHDLIPGAPPPSVSPPSIGSKFWAGANRLISAGGALLTAAGHYFDRQHRDNVRTLGILQQTIIEKRAEVERWRSYADEQGDRIEAGFAELRSDIATFNADNEAHGCGWSRLDVDQMRSLLDAPPEATGAAGPVPQHILETEPPIRRATAEERREERERDRERFVCRTYDGDLAAWNALVAQLTPKLDEWDRELRRWAARGAAVQRVMAERGRIERDLSRAIWGASGVAPGETALALGEGGLAIAGIFAATWPVALALGVGGILVGVARGNLAPSDAQMLVEGRLAAEMQFWTTRMAYIQAEITRLTTMRTEVLSELQRRRIRLDRTYDWCSQWWQDRGEHHVRAEPVPTSYRYDYTNYAAYRSPGYSAMPTAALMKEIRTWR